MLYGLQVSVPLKKTQKMLIFNNNIYSYFVFIMELNVILHTQASTKFQQ